MERKVIVILDAFRWDYISKYQTPFLYNLKENNLHIEKLEASPGFCERSEIFTGLTPNQSGNFLAYGLKKDISLNKNHRLFKILFMIERLIKRWGYFELNYNKKKISSQKIIRFLFKKLFKKSLQGSQLIPYDFLPFFELTEDKYSMTNILEYPFQTFFDTLNRNKIKFSTEAFTNLNLSSNLNDLDRIKLLEKIVADKSIIYAFLYLGEVDFLGHKLGPKKLINSGNLLLIDKKIKSLYKKIKKLDNDIKFIFIGDHGMLEIKKDFDIESKILLYVKKHKLKRSVDVIWFIDSNYFRIWFFKEKEFHINCFKNEVSYEEFGSYISLKKLEKLNLDSTKYGDLLWYAHKEVLIYPNFFNSTKLQGMHGYYLASEASNGTAIIETHRKDFKQKLSLNEIKNYF